MVFKAFIGTISVFLVVVSFNVSAALVSVDWKTVDDNLITHDLATGLDWLDLTETNNMSYNLVSGQLGSGGNFDGWRYATSTEVISLWNNFNISLTSGSVTSIVNNTVPDYIDPDIQAASSLLGNIVNEYSPDLIYGTVGIVADIPIGVSGVHTRMGAYQQYVSTYSTYMLYEPVGLYHEIDDTAQLYFGSYLVRDTVVPVPAAVWLFGSGLIGLIGVARRKKV